MSYCCLIWGDRDFCTTQVHFQTVVYEDQHSVGFFLFYYRQTLNKNRPNTLHRRAGEKTRQLRALAALPGGEQIPSIHITRLQLQVEGLQHLFGASMNTSQTRRTRAHAHLYVKVCVHQQHLPFPWLGKLNWCPFANFQVDEKGANVTVDWAGVYIPFLRSLLSDTWKFFSEILL